MQRHFRTDGGASFACTLDFTAHDYANLHFVDASGESVLFHLSFRFPRQLVVYNARIENRWGQERHQPAAFSRQGTRLEIVFLDDATRVRLDGTELPGFPPVLQGEPGGSAVSHLRVDGQVQDVAIDGPANTAHRGHLLQTRPFRLEGWGYDPTAAEQSLALELRGAGKRLRSAVLPRPRIAAEHGAPTPDIGLLAPLPGWVWEELPEGQDRLEIDLLVNGAACCAPVTMSRDDLIDMIEQLAARERDEEDGQDPFELLSAIEHVRFAGIAPLLSEPCRARLMQAARRYQAAPFLAPALAELPRPEHAPPPRQTEESPAPPDGNGASRSSSPGLAAPAVQTGGTGARRRDPLLEILPLIGPASPDEMVRILRDHPVERLLPDERRVLMLALAGRFCDADRFDALYRVAQAAGLSGTASDMGAWTLTPAMPYHLTAGRGAELRASLARLAEFDGQWIDTAPLAWTMRRIIGRRPACLTEVERIEAIEHFLAFLGRMVPRYFRIGPSRRLIDVAVDLLARIDTLPDDRRDGVIEAVLGCYRLSPTFWEQVSRRRASGEIAADLAIDGAERIFRAIEAGVEGAPGGGGPAAVLAAESADWSEAARLRREARAALRIDGGEDPLPQRPSSSAISPDDMLLRYLAFPVATPERPDLAAAAARAIRHVNGVAVSPYPEVQERAGRAIRLLLSGTAPATAQDLDAIFADLRLLADARVGAIGCAMGVSLLNAALRGQVLDLAEAVLPRVGELMHSVPAGEQEAMHASPGVRMAVYGLCQTLQVHEGPLADEARALCPDVFSALPLSFAAQTGRDDPEPLEPGTPAGAFLDTLVVVYSCRPNLETRLPALRAAWLDRLEAMGVPWIVVVGDGDGRREGRVVHLDAPDSYEGLPQKSLAMVEWVYRNTGFAHLLKVDDDCFLDLERFFDSQSYRRFAYYGRPLHRVVGQTDRIWHHPRSRSEAAARELDKSPEPSTYADGGSGYVLNRKMMELLGELKRTPRGAWLTLTSFMEDKLVGDLLGIAGVLPDGEDYTCCILRRMHAGGRPVSKWETGFLPGPLTPTRLAHLDDTSLQPVAAAQRDRATLWPKRLWPTYAPLRMGWNDNNVELVSMVERLGQVNAAPLCVVGCVRNELTMLPRFLQHYRGIGVAGFLMVDNCSDDGTLEYLEAQPDVAVFSAASDYRASAYGVAWQQAVIANLRMNRWSLIADADELLMMRAGEPDVGTMLAHDDFAGADAARVFMLDLYPKGPLSQTDFTHGDPFETIDHCDRVPFIDRYEPGPFANSGTWTSALRHRLLPDSRGELFVAQKIALLRHKPWMRMTAGVHFVSEVRLARRELVFGHFKYHAAFRAKVQAETERAQHFNDAEEYRRYLALLSEGREVLYDPEVSVSWRDCDWVRERLG